jgi:hypothetical protein
MTQSELNSTVYVTEGFDINEITLREYLDDYARAVECEYYIQECYENGENTEYEIYKSRVNRNDVFCMSCDSKEDAESFIYDAIQDHQNNHSYNFQSCENLKSQAIFWIADRENRSIEVIERYLQIRDGIKQREAAQKAIRQAQYDAQKAQIANNTTADIAHLKPLVDDQFKADLVEAGKLTGIDKSNAQSAALSTFLIRVGYFITGDFWKVFRAIK